jgi:hypothetical protein
VIPETVATQLGFALCGAAISVNLVAVVARLSKARADVSVATELD